jgi:hypothetical protein
MAATGAIGVDKDELVGCDEKCGVDAVVSLNLGSMEISRREDAGILPGL